MVRKSPVRRTKGKGHEPLEDERNLRYIWETPVGTLTEVLHFDEWKISSYFVYSIYSHEGDWREAETPRRGDEVNRPLLALPLTGVAGEFAGEMLDAIKISETAEACRTCPEVMSIPDSRSFVRVNSSNAMISAFKRAEDNNGLVIRVYESEESEGREADVEVLFGFNVSKVTELDRIERPVPAATASPGTGARLEGNILRFHLAKHEIRTFLLQ
ncbi:MAG TPA: hypothetical protein GXX51_02020 [Firmicutes bacterium]|nr:hypothetical protein [Bacillota bacterium]